MRLLVGLILLIFTLASCKPQAESAPAASPILTGSCTVGRWSRLTGTNNTSLSVLVSTDFSGNEQTAIGQVANQWNTAIPGKTFFSMGQTATNANTDVSQFRDNVFGIYKSQNWFSNVSSQALAITQFYGIVQTDPSLGTYINLLEADIIVNYRDFANRLTITPGPGDFDLPTVIVHEMGHFLGLCHETTHQSIMQPYYNSTQRALMAYDKTKINDLYTNNYITPMLAKAGVNALASSPGTPVRGIIELRANGKCLHYINGKLVYQH